MNLTKKEKVQTLLPPCLFIVFGILFCVIPNEFLSIVETILAVGLIGYGLVCVILYCFTSSQFRNTSHLVLAVITICLGFLVSLIPSFFIFGIGLIVLTNGIARIKIANDLKVAEVSKWWIELIFGIVILLIGLVIVVMCNTKIAREILMIIFGVSLLVNGILSFVSYFILDFKLKKLNEKQQNEDFKDYKVK